MRATLIAHNFENEETRHTPFEGPSCIEECHNFQKSIEEDWPGFYWGIFHDEEAGDDNYRRMMLLFGIDPDEPED